jgi:hypothetical protein
MRNFFATILFLICVAVTPGQTIPSPGPGTAMPHSGGGSTPTFVNYSPSNNGAGCSTCTFSITAPTSGHLVTACVTWQTTTVNLNSVSDTLANTWTAVASTAQTDTPNNFRFQCYSSLLTTGGTDSISYHLSGNSFDVFSQVGEYSNVPGRNDDCGR